MGEKGTRRFRRQLGIAAAAVVAVAALATAPTAQSSALVRASTFDTTSEGWFVDDQGTFSPATWQSTGGNPGGYITGQFHPPNFGLFQSVPMGTGSTWPAGNALGDYGGTLQADIQASDPTSDALLGLFSSNSSVLPCVDMGTVLPTWSTYTATLDTTHLVDCFSGKPLTGAQTSAALAGFDAMFLLVVDSDATADTVSLDNAALTGPALAGTHPTGAVTRALTFAYKAHRFQGTLTAGNDYSCAAKTKVTIFRKRGAAGVKVGTATTGAASQLKQNGPATYSLKVKVVKGSSYYASLKKTTSSLDGNSCSAAKSKSVKAP